MRPSITYPTKELRLQLGLEIFGLFVFLYHQSIFKDKGTKNCEMVQLFVCNLKVNTIRSF